MLHKFVIKIILVSIVLYLHQIIKVNPTYKVLMQFTPIIIRRSMLISLIRDANSIINVFILDLCMTFEVLRRIVYLKGDTRCSHIILDQLSGYLAMFARSSPKTSAISIYGTSPEVHHYYIWSSQVCGKSTANFICMIKSRRKVAANNLLSCKLRRRFTKNLSHAHIWNVARSSPLPYMAISSLPQIYGKFNLHDKKSP